MKIATGLVKWVAPIALLSSATSLMASSSDEPSLGEVYIEDIAYNGSGCPIGTVAETLSADQKAFTLTFAEYIAETAPYLSPRDARKNCQLTVSLHIPQGFQFSIGTFDYRGFVALDEDIKANHSTSYYFQGQGFTGRFSEDIYGPEDDFYQFREEVGLASLIWSPCGASRALNINTAISVRNMNKRYNPDAEGIIGTDSIDGQIKQIFGLRWRRCRAG